MAHLHTIGYAHKNAQATLDEHVAQGGLVVDIRLSPVTKIPGFTARELSARYKLQYGHIPDLGNVNHHTRHDIVLKNEAYGLARLDRALAKGAVMLLCGCMWVNTCHRLYVALLAQGRHPELEPVHLLQGEHEGMIKHRCAIPLGKCAYMVDGLLCPFDCWQDCERCKRPICDMHTNPVSGWFTDRSYPYCPVCYDQHLNEQIERD